MAYGLADETTSMCAAGATVAALHGPVGADDEFTAASWQVRQTRLRSVLRAAGPRGEGGKAAAQWVYGIAVDAQDRVWFGTEGGVSMFDGTNWRSWTHRDGLGAPNAEDLPASANTGLGTKKRHDLSTQAGRQAHLQRKLRVCDSRGARRFGVGGTWGGGLSRFDGRTWKTYTVAEGLPGNHVFALHVDRTGDLWIGTNDGLAVRQREGFRVLKTEDGLFSNTVFSIASGADGSLWVGSYGGVAHLRRPR